LISAPAVHASPSRLARIAGHVRRAVGIVRTIVGAPDYERYRRHLHACHPDAEPMTRDQFTRDRLARRYDQPGSRCC
jgi:uncharacterized short protein YbdD (DUF466 family)